MAWKIDKRLLIIWYGLSGLPAIVLGFYQENVDLLSRHIAYQNIEFAQVFGLLLAFGIVTILTGLSKRINSQFVYMVMYDAYIICAWSSIWWTRHTHWTHQTFNHGKILPDQKQPALTNKKDLIY